MRSFNNAFLIQEKNKIIFNRQNLKFVTNLKPSKKEIAQAEFAFNVCKYVKSNSIVISNSFSTIGIGAGQPSRVDSCEIAVKKAKSFQKKKLKNSVAASDAFFPFPDGVKKLINRHNNSSLKTELENATEEIRQKSLKKEYKEKGIKENLDILDDDLTIIGIGK